MARPRTPIGTFGAIEFTGMPDGSVRARVRFRDHDRKVRRIEASDSTRKLAEHLLKEKLAQRSGIRGIGELGPDSFFTRLVDVWLADLDLEGKLALSTRALYVRNMRQLVMPAFEHLSWREITLSRVGCAAQPGGRSCSWAPRWGQCSFASSWRRTRPHREWRRLGPSGWPGRPCWFSGRWRSP